MNATPTVKPRCKHGLIAGMCAQCTPTRKRLEPQNQPAMTVHAAEASSFAQVYEAGLVVVHTNNGQASFMKHEVSRLDATTTTVHIAGHLFLWTIEAVLSAAPNLKMIQVIPSMLPKCSERHREMCRARGVAIVAGHVRPEACWDNCESRSPVYALQRRFLLSLAGPQRALFDELRALGFDAAEMAVRYYGLEGEPVTQRALAADYGYGPVSSKVSAKVLAVLHYLDDSTEVGEISKVRSRAMRIEVARLRPLVASAALQRAALEEVGLQAFAPGFPFSRLAALRAVVAASRDGRLRALEKKDPRAHRALVLRFGLDSSPPCTVYRTLAMVGDMIGGVSRERARQLEERALAALEIEVDP